MKKKSRPSQDLPKAPRVECVPLSHLRQRRHSKHRDLIRDVLQELKTLQADSAVKIELLGIPAKTLRSAMFRAVSLEGLKITSFSDSDYLYIVKRSSAPLGRDSKQAARRTE